MGGLTSRRAVVLTVSDGVSAGVRDDTSGDALSERLVGAGFEVERALVADDVDEISSAIREAARSHDLVVTTGGTGLGPRDVTPEATGAVLDRDAPGLVQLILTRGIESTPFAALSRAKAGTLGNALVINLPGSPSGATEGLSAVIEIIPHALDLLAGDTEHR